MLNALSRLFAGLSAAETTVVVLALSLVSAVFVEFVLLRVARRVVTHTDTDVDNIVLAELRAPLVVTAALVGVALLTTLPSVANNVVVPPAQLDTFFGKPALVVIALTWAWALNRTVNRVVEAVKTRGSRFDFAPVFSNVWTILVTVGTAAFLLSLYEVDVTPLVGAAGIAGIAVGFAAKDTVANFFGGIALYFDDTYKIGDYIVLDTGEAGTVVKVGVRSTTLLTRDEVLVTVPNSVLNAAKIVNESAPQRRRRIRVPVGVAYGTDVDVFEPLVVDIASAEPLVLDSPKPRMRLRRFGDSALEYELLCWVASPTRRSRAHHELNRAIYRALADADIEIPYPRRDLTVRSDSAGADADADATVAGDTVGDAAGGDGAGDADVDSAPTTARLRDGEPSGRET